jgi:hypothetical protein
MFFFSAIFSGKMWTSQKMVMPISGAMMIATHEMPLATASSVSPLNKEACALAG